MIAIEKMSKAFGSQHLYKDVSFSVDAGEKIALLGPNGAGKTTFFRILTGEETPDRGDIRFPKQFRLKTLRQEWEPEKGHSILDVCLMQFDEWWNSHKEVQTLSENLGEDEESLNNYANADAVFTALGSYTVIQEAREMLVGLGFAESQLTDTYETLSGGWRMRVQLAGLLVSKPDTLLLDEPTNHLDIESIEWFETFLSSYPHTVLVITHDRRLAENVCNQVLDFSPPQLVKWPYGVKRFEQEKELRMQVVEAEIQNKEKEVAKLEDFARRFRAKATKARQAQSKLKSSHKVGDEIEKLKEELPLIRTRRTQFRLELKDRMPRQVANFTDAEFGYAGHDALFSMDSCLIEGGKKIGIIGANGVGKSTFLKTIAGELPLLSGERVVSQALRLGYFAQHRMEELPLDKKAIDYITENIEGIPIARIRSVCGALGLRDIDLDKDIRILSGGEKARLSLSLILLTVPHVLLLDEPTNHLDIEACDALIDGLKAYTGTLLVVSHNRNFLDLSCENILEVKKGEAIFHLGSYSEWAERRERLKGESADLALSNTVKKDTSSKASSKKSKEQKREEARQRQLRYQAEKELKNDIERISQRSGEVQKLIQEIDAFLAQPDQAHGDIFSDKLKQRADLEKEQSELENKWLELENARELAERGE